MSNHLPASPEPESHMWTFGGDRIRTWPSRLPVAAGICVAAVGAAVLCGWVFHVGPLRAEFPGVAAIRPNTAVFFLWGGLALALLADRAAPRGRRIVGLTFATIAVAWAGVDVIEFVLTAALVQYKLVFAGLASVTHVPFTATTSVWHLVFVGLLGAAPFFLNTRRIHWFGELLVVVPLSISFLSLVGEAFRVISPAGATRASTLPNVVTFLVLELGLLLARPDRGWMGILTGPGLGGALARRLLPFTVVVPFAGLWLRQVAEQAGYIGKESAGTIYALIFVFVQSVPIMWYAAAVNRTDRKRAAAEEFVRALLRIGARLNSTLDVDALLSILAAEAARLVSADSARAGLRMADGMTCQWYFRNGEPLARQSICPSEEELPGWVAQQMDRNRANADRQIDPKLRVRFDDRSWLSAPILDSRGDLLGFVEVNKKDGDFTVGDQERLLAVAQSATSAVQNALAYQHLHEVQQALKSADRHKDEFLATLAHELRNPLAPLRNGLQIMRLAGPNWEAVEPARAMMERQLGQMTRLIDDLLDLSRISRGKIELRKERVELAAAVRQAAETSGPVIKQASHAVAIDLPPEPIHVDADVTRLAQVFANLLNNAAKFTAQGGHIQLTVARHGDEAVVSVRDNGVGIPTEMLPRVFDMFTQVDRSLERSQGGLGIGLSLVKGLIEMHGGRVEAASPGPGMGSEFVVRLPVVAPPAGKRPIAADEAIQTAGRRILVVDDNQDAAASLAMLLTSMGNETRTAHDGLTALEVGAAFRPDVVLLDIGMPKLNGYDTARRIREEPWGQAVNLVALTGWGQEDARRRSREAGFDHHAVKPIESAALAKLLNGSANGQCNAPGRSQLEAG